MSVHLGTDPSSEVQAPSLSWQRLNKFCKKKEGTKEDGILHSSLAFKITYNLGKESFVWHMEVKSANYCAEIQPKRMNVPGFWQQANARI
jgi:hypothetical protein